MQIEEDATLVDLLQDDDEVFDEVSAEEDSGFESDSIEEAVPEEGQPMDMAEVNSDAETIDNHPDEVQSDSDSADDSDMDEVTLRRTMRVSQRFFRGVQQLLRLQRDEEMRRMRRRLRGIQRRIRRRRHDCNHNAPRRYRDMCYGCAKRFWYQRNRHWIRYVFCGFWLCPDCNVDPVHSQNQRQFLQ